MKVVTTFMTGASCEGGFLSRDITEYLDVRDSHLLLKVTENTEGRWLVVRIYAGAANSRPAARRLRKRIQKMESFFRMKGFIDCQSEHEHIAPEGASVLLVRHV